MCGFCQKSAQGYDSVSYEEIIINAYAYAYTWNISVSKKYHSPHVVMEDQHYNTLVRSVTAHISFLLAKEKISSIQKLTNGWQLWISFGADEHEPIEALSPCCFYMDSFC